MESPRHFFVVRCRRSVRLCREHVVRDCAGLHDAAQRGGKTRGGRPDILVLWILLWTVMITCAG